VDTSLVARLPLTPEQKSRKGQVLSLLGSLAPETTPDSNWIRLADASQIVIDSRGLAQAHSGLALLMLARVYGGPRRNSGGRIDPAVSYRL
jgi:hypothetical protein